MNAIPVVDLAHLASTDATIRSAAENDLRTAFGSVGLIYLTGHGIAQKDLLSFYDSFRSFVARPVAAKRPMARADLWFQRGWTPPNTEIAVASGGQPDFKECYFAVAEEPPEELRLQFPELCPANVWPEPPEPGFREGYLSLSRALHAAGLRLLEGCASALDLPRTTFTDLVKHGAHVTRVLNYLPLTESQVASNVLWGEEHTDFNLVTLLPGGRFYDPSGKPAAKPDDKSGLFLRTRATAANPNGTMVPGRAPEGCITAQVGQEFEILTGGTFLATPHVITAPGVPGWSRMSGAHFVHMSANEILYPLKKFATTTARKEYGPPVLAGTYSMKTLVDIGLAPKEVLDQIGYRHYDRLDTMRAASKS